MKAVPIKQQKFFSKNPLVRYANQRYFGSILKLTKISRGKKVLDCGCGEGLLLDYLSRHLKKSQFIGFDIDDEEVKWAKKLAPKARVIKASIYKIPFKADFCDLALCAEVLEHLEKPQAAVKEVARVTSKYALFTVPFEPIYRIANLTRLAYISRLGDEPTHIQHWSPKTFQRLLEPHFHLEKVIYPLPWMMFLVKKKSSK